MSLSLSTHLLSYIKPSQDYRVCECTADRVPESMLINS